MNIACEQSDVYGQTAFELSKKQLDIVELLSESQSLGPHENDVRQGPTYLVCHHGSHAYNLLAIKKFDIGFFGKSSGQLVSGGALWSKAVGEAGTGAAGCSLILGVDTSFEKMIGTVWSDGSLRSGAAKPAKRELEARPETRRLVRRKFRAAPELYPDLDISLVEAQADKLAGISSDSEAISHVLKHSVQVVHQAE